MMLLHDLQATGLDMPNWLADSTPYLTIMGSMAYGVSTDLSDQDIYGFVIPPKEMLFPHLAGHLRGFDEEPQNFKVYDPHKVVRGEVEYDFAIYNILHYFRLVLANNPNMLDSLFTPERCVLHLDPVGRMVRENRSIFLSKLARSAYKGFANNELQRVLHQKTINSPKLRERVERYGYDIKGAYHVVRLMLEAEQLLLEGDLDLERHVDILTEVRAGEWTRARVEAFDIEMMGRLETASEASALPDEPDRAAIKSLLLDCLEEHYGTISDAIICG